MLCQRASVMTTCVRACVGSLWGCFGRWVNRGGGRFVHVGTDRASRARIDAYLRCFDGKWDPLLEVRPLREGVEGLYGME